MWSACAWAKAASEYTRLPSVANSRVSDMALQLALTLACPALHSATVPAVSLHCLSSAKKEQSFTPVVRSDRGASLGLIFPMVSQQTDTFLNLCFGKLCTSI